METRLASLLASIDARNPRLQRCQMTLSVKEITLLEARPRINT
jgi:hypothetical protein